MSQEKSDFIEFCKFSDNDFICFQNNSSEYSDIDSFHKQKFLSCDLGILHLNIASLNKYRDELESFLNVLNYKFRLIGVTEHKLGINDFLHFPLQDFSFIYNCRTSTHGGAGIFISHEFSFKKRNDLEIEKHGELESVAIELILENQKNLICFCIYKHPIMSITEFMNLLIPVLHKTSQENKTCIILGDFNIDLLKCDENNAVSNFLSIMTSYCFSPCILQPTRITKTSTTLIDNIFFNGHKNTYSGNFTYQISDHLVQFLVVNEFYKGQKIDNKMPVKRRNYSRFKSDLFRSELKELSFDLSLGANESFSKFYNTVTYVLDEHAPEQYLTKRQKKTLQKPWITSEILLEIRIRNNLFDRFCKSKNPSSKAYLYDVYKKQRNLVSQKIRNSKQKYNSKYFEENMKNAKSGDKSNPLFL